MRPRIALVSVLAAACVLAACFVYAQMAVWKPVELKYTWDRLGSGFCTRAEQCLVSNAGNESFDDQPEKYWTGYPNYNDMPKCINTTQYIADYYCENGAWTSRTKLIAMQLLGLAIEKSHENFTLYCDNYKAVLNEYNYMTDYGLVTGFLGKLCWPFNNTKKQENCANNICVLSIPNGVAFGMAINTPIDSEKSPLKALNKSPTLCNGAKNDDGDYDPCGENVWYNHNIESILYVPITGVSLPQPSPTVSTFFYSPFLLLKDYVFSQVHKPIDPLYNYTFFNTTPLFDQMYFSKKGNKYAFSFREINVTLSRVSYAGFYFANIRLPSNFCVDWIKKFDDSANCVAQPYPNEFYIIARKDPTKIPSIVDSWPELAGKLRVS